MDAVNDWKAVYVEGYAIALTRGRWKIVCELVLLEMRKRGEDCQPYELFRDGKPAGCFNTDAEALAEIDKLERGG